ncbi:related to CAF120 CCR4 Associated Factor 120 kDa [Rhynchosporium graminicola]|uniref:Related to CAF120 CCR4 Associated Factor 120 kDa n=1 Tax=Rhynchosporium graminicola TaxID=2792576 RepID=A0A1E1KU20_9HELO|nr:related to CAF120 CCR4 Associated Factor 120 kDa [Rhynchosporium commune]
MSTRNRVLSFMSNFSSSRDSQRSPTPTSSTPKQELARSEPAQHATTMPLGNSTHNTDQPRVQRERAQSGSRPLSMVQTYYPSMMDVSQDTLPELQPIFTFLNSHANKLYQEGYFLKLDDQNTHGRPNADRTWTECFAQLVGTVLSLWDAADLDAAGQDGEVLPKFINLTDASIKMIEALPTRADSEAPLQNVLSISTAGKNRYLLHFNSHHSLIQWTAGIRLSMFEHATLQEAYTGALIAGKGKGLNNINIIMDRARIPTADWARVRFGAGTPWRRCWCVVSPPDEKEVQKLQKQLNKKKSAYDRSRPPTLRGDIKFYDSKKTKKVRPIATISDAYSAFAIYPQSKPLIDASTLVKVEGSITIHSNPPSTSEGFVFVMPETHAAVTGFEMMLRWLFPVFDTFGLYGRPGRLVADTSDPKSLMFAMPKHRRYGYLEILDVSGLILEPGSASWKEGEWRKRLKELTGKRMKAIESSNQPNSRYSSRRSTMQNNVRPPRNRIQFDDGASVRSTPGNTWGQGQTDGASGIPRTDSAPPGAGAFAPPIKTRSSAHTRSFSESQRLDQFRDQVPSNYDGGYDHPPAPPPHTTGVAASRDVHSSRYIPEIGSTPERISSEDEQAARATPVRELQELQATTNPEPVAAPPAFAHGPGSLPISKPYQSPELRRANSRMSNATLSQLAGAGGVAGYHAHGDEGRGYNQPSNGDRGVLPAANVHGLPANHDGLNEGLVTVSKPRYSYEDSSPSHPTNVTMQTSLSQPSAQHSATSHHLSSSDASRIGSQPPLASREPLLQTRIYEPPQMFNSPVSNVHSGAIGHGHDQQHSTDSAHRNAAQPRLQTSPSILRKPLPTRSSSLQAPASADTQSSLGSLGQHVIDQTAFEMIGRDDHLPIRGPETQLYRHNTDASSVYEDNASTASPDYASTRRSVDARNSVEKPRAGVLKTVGNSEDPRYLGNQAATSPPIEIDFGPTFNLASGAGPRSQSPGPSQAYGRAASPGPTLTNLNTPQPPRHGSPATRPDSAGYSRSPARKPLTPENAYYRDQSSESRTVAWSPGMATNASAGSKMSITPEQFVHQRASMAPATPLYAHHRQPSSNTLRANTPPLVGRSSDYMAQHSRNSSADLLQRPSSRGANVILGPSGNGDMPTSLSAREQEQVAKMTGTPLISMANNNKAQGPPSGLVGAIEAREREKQHMKQGINSQAVQNAISQRQQQALHHQHQQQYQEQMASEYRAPQQYNIMGQYQQYPQTQRPQEQQNWGMSPAASAFAQGGGWSASTPSPGFAGPEQGRQSPSQYPPRQQQHFPQQQQQQQPPQQGRGNSTFHGHGH